MLFGAGRLLASPNRKSCSIFKGSADAKTRRPAQISCSARHEKIVLQPGSLETGELRCLLGLTLATLTAEPDRYGTINPNEI
jgi:hypothetical protein